MKKILVVDDDQISTMIISDKFRHKGYQVSVLNDPNSFEDVFFQLSPDIILLDLKMPSRSGMDLLKDIRKKYSKSELPVIIVTSSDRDEDIVKALDFGANDYLTKPLNFKIANSRVKSQLGLKELSFAQES